MEPGAYADGAQSKETTPQTPKFSEKSSKDRLKSTPRPFEDRKKSAGKTNGEGKEDELDLNITARGKLAKPIDHHLKGNSLLDPLRA